MKRTLFLLLPLAMACSQQSTTQSGEYVTKAGGYCACTERADLESYIEFSSVKDYEAMQALINSGRCGIMQGGHYVYVKSMAIGLREIRPKGEPTTAWTVAEALTEAPDTNKIQAQ